jgi:tRNA U38,U39,U40 pseudouridine synthase TruA
MAYFSQLATDLKKVLSLINDKIPRDNIRTLAKSSQETHFNQKIELNGKTYNYCHTNLKNQLDLKLILNKQ